MKTIRKTSALLLSLLLSVTLVLTGCASVAGSADKAVTSSAAPSETLAQQSPEASQTPEATQTQEAMQTPQIAEQLSYVSVDVNPSLKLTIKEGIVIEAVAYNDDGAKIVLENDVTGMTPDEALKTYIQAFALGGYITNEGTEASLVITANGEDSDELITSLQDSAAAKLTELGLTCNVVVSTVENSIDEEAKANGLTPGKYLALKYLAEKEGITLDEAKAKYGSLKMGKIVKMLDDVDAVFGHRDDESDLQGLIDSGILTPEQSEILTQAQAAFTAAMKQAQATFKQSMTQARELWQSSKSQIQSAFKADRDKDKWKTAKDSLRVQMQEQKKTAIGAFKQAKIQAQEQFRLAVESLGLTDEQIAALTEWGFGFEWNFDNDWSTGTDEQDDKEQAEPSDSDKETDAVSPQKSSEADKPVGNENGKGKGGSSGKGENKDGNKGKDTDKGGNNGKGKKD